ncbi:MAG: 50S ribosomal protein L9 [Clostridia bacterium]|nr:50S ribosomal protein L9 [Clostridia bacterium]
MKVILLKDVKGQGKKDQIINVSDGYANNYLIKNGLAVAETKRSKEVLDNQIAKRQHEEDMLVAEYNEIAKKLNDKDISFKVKTGAQDRVFGTISTKQISDELKKIGYTIDKKCIKPNSNIDCLGTHKVSIELHKRVKFNINVVLKK